MAPRILSIAVGGLGLAAALPATMPTTDYNIVSAYEQSIAACEHGADGVIVTFKSEEARSRLASLAHDNSADTIDSFFEAIPAVSAHLSADTISSYFSSDEVESVEADCVTQLEDEYLFSEELASNLEPDITDEEEPEEGPEGDLQADGTDQLNPPWGLDRIDSRAGTDGKYNHGKADGSKSRVYILDTGIRISHKDFGGRALPGHSVGCPTGNGCANGWLPFGVATSNMNSLCSRGVAGSHGTHVASTAVGNKYGVAKNASVISVQLLDCRSGRGTISGYVKAIDWAVADAKKHPNTRAVISMSVRQIVSASIHAAVKRAHTAGVPLAASAGNRNRSACSQSPASAPEAITVGSTDRGDMKSSFSNHGKCVDIHAPGRAITGAMALSDTSTASLSGTSMSTPHVAGAMAQLLTEQPSISAARAIEVLTKCMATKNAVKGLPSDTVNGFLYAGAAMAEPSQTACVPPPPPPPGMNKTLTFDFEQPVGGPGWKNGGTPLPSIPTPGSKRSYPFSRRSGKTPTRYTGPSTGYPDKGFYYYAETSYPRNAGDVFSLSYDGSGCDQSRGEELSALQFKYHMYGRDMGTLYVEDAAGKTVWSKSGGGGFGSNVWKDSGEMAMPGTGGFTFWYKRGNGWLGDAAIDSVTVKCTVKGGSPGKPLVDRLMAEVQAKAGELAQAINDWTPSAAFTRSD